MIFLRYSDKGFKTQIAKLFKRKAYPPEIEDKVRDIIKEVRKRGDPAISHFAKQIDGVSMKASQFKITQAEIDESRKKLGADIKNAIKYAMENVTLFSEKKIPSDWSFTPRKGVTVGERYEPYESLGVYIPGGKAPLVSTAIHTITLAKIAGIRNIVAVTPPGKDGKLLPEMIYSMSEAGATEIFRIGGVYAIAALAYGTKTVRKVEKIVGPGNAYVTAAKKLVYGDVAIDMVAGPSEIMVIAEKGQNPEFIAADLLSQAEHGSGLEQALMLSNDHDLLVRTAEAVRRQAKTLSREVAICKVIRDGMYFIEVENIGQATEIAGDYAPEHLEILCKHPEKVAKKIRAAGAIFLGKWTPEPVGDFTAGPSHVLPTGGAARYFSGLRIEDFFRRISMIEYQKCSLERDLPAIAKFAETEGLDAHGRSTAVRFSIR